MTEADGLSPDEIIFDDIKYREPERRCRPDRDPHWACLAYGVPQPADLPIYLERVTADLIERHALSDTSVELGGILLGKECVDDLTGLPFVLVTKSLEAKHFENTQASFTYTHDSWEEISRERDRLHPDLDIVGWYHTHPDFGIFLSGHDQFIHRHFFAQPLQLAYVVDPIRQTRGFFQWRAGELEQVGGFHLFAERADRLALSRLVNDLENLPNQEGGGGSGLTPRLEAQLIAMLTRPTAHHQASSLTSPVLPLLFGLIGTLVGVLIMGVGLALFQLYRQTTQQSQSMAALQQNTQEIVAAQRLTLNNLIEDAGERDPDVFRKQFDKALRDRSELERQISQAKTREDTLTAEVQRLTENAKILASDLAKNKEIVELFDKQRKDSPNLVARLAKVETELDDKEKLLARKELVLKTVESAEETEALLERYDKAWYAAAVGWGLLMVTGLGVFTLFNQSRGSLAPLPNAQSPDDQTTHHRIT